MEFSELLEPEEVGIVGLFTDMDLFTVYSFISQCIYLLDGTQYAVPKSFSVSVPASLRQMCAWSS